MKKYLTYLKASIALGLMLFVVGCSGSQSVILTGLNQDEANAVVLKLGNNNIKAEKSWEKGDIYTITVAKSQEIHALSILNHDGAPGQRYETMGQIFKKDSFISSPLEEQSRFIYALQEQISSMISEIDGVTYVSTQVSLPPPSDNLWQTQEIKPSAAVFIKFEDSYHLKMYSNRIKQLVANSVPGLTADRVEIMLMSSKDE